MESGKIMFSSKKKYLAFFLSLILVLTLVVGCGDDDELEETGYTFRPEEDYPVRDFSDVNAVYLGTIDEEGEVEDSYTLEQEEPGKWTGDFTLDEGTEYVLFYDKDDDPLFFDNLATIPTAADSNLIAGLEDETEVIGSLDWAADFDDAVLTYNQALRISDSAEEIGDVFVDEADADWNGESIEIDLLADSLADRSVIRWSTAYFHQYQDEFTVEGSIVVDNKGDWEEYYTLNYDTEQGWLITDFETRDANVVTVTEIEAGEEYKLEFDLAKAIANNRDFEAEVDDYEYIVLTGEFNGWKRDETGDYEYSFEEQEDDIWELIISSDSDLIDDDKDEAEEFKVLGITEDADFVEDEGFHYAPSGFGTERSLSDWVEITKEITD